MGGYQKGLGLSKALLKAFAKLRINRKRKKRKDWTSEYRTRNKIGEYA